MLITELESFYFVPEFLLVLSRYICSMHVVVMETPCETITNETPNG